MKIIAKYLSQFHYGSIKTRAKGIPWSVIYAESLNSTMVRLKHYENRIK